MSDKWGDIARTLGCEVTEEADALRKEVERLREACWIFQTYGLPPNDVSGSAEWKRALLMMVGTPIPKGEGDD